MVKRFSDWPTRLHNYLQKKADEPFAYGANDCQRFACGAIEAMTGTDPAAAFRGKYDSKRGAARIIRETCDGTLANLTEKICAEQGMKEVPPLFAQRGDLVLLAMETGYSLGIVGNDGIKSYFVSPDGLKTIPASATNRAWRVG